MGEASFGKYRLIAELGHGGMADVFLAVMAGPVGSGFSKLTVVKRLRQNLADEPEFIEMLVDEARIAARLNHPNVVQTNEVGNVGSQYFLAMEYLDGQPLHRIQHRAAQMMSKWAERGPDASEPPPSSATPATSAGMFLPSDPFPRDCQYLVLADALAGLHHAHELPDYDGTPLQIVHRDVTPHNIFVTYDGQVKVVDFGIAKAVGRSSETREGVVKGKVRYMAPEQAIGQPVDRRADVFSVGVMLWEAATGRRMWKDKDDLDIVQALMGGAVPASPAAIDPSVPTEIDRICRKALASDANDRYATAEEFRTDIDQYLVESGRMVTARRKLGQAVTELFKDKRAELRGVIEKQLVALKASGGTTTLRTVKVADASGSLPSSDSGASAPSGALAVSIRSPDDPSIDTHSATEIYTMSGKKKSAVSPRILVLAATVAAAAFVGVMFVNRRAAPVTTAAPPTESTSCVLTIRATPPEAKIFFDDAPLSGNPAISSFRRDDVQHRMRVEAAGFLPKAQFVTLEHAQISLDVVLAPEPVAAVKSSGPTGTERDRSKGPSATVAGPVARPNVVTAAQARDSRPPAPPPPVTATPEPHVAPPPPPATTRGADQLDKTDPWAPSSKK